MQNSCDAPVYEPDTEAKDDSLTNESPGYNHDNAESMTDGVESEVDYRLRCGTGCLKSLIVLVNLTFMAVGMVLIGLIVWIHIYRESFIYYRLIEDAASSLHPPPSHLSQQQQQQQHPQQQQQQHIPAASVIQRTTVIVVIALVVVIIAIGFLGCCGASAESICFLCLCVVLIVSVLIAEIVIASVVPSFKEKMYSDLFGRMKYQIRTEYNRTTAIATTEKEAEEKLSVQQLTLAWDTLQTRFNCCGVSGPHDFRDSTWFNQTKDYEGLYVPTTCCVLEDSEKPVFRNLYLCQVEALLHQNTEMPLKELHVTGCHEAFVSYVESFVRHPLTIATLTIFIILQLIDLILCCILILWIKRKLREIDASLNDDSDQDDVDEE